MKLIVPFLKREAWRAGNDALDLPSLAETQSCAWRSGTGGRSPPVRALQVLNLPRPREGLADDRLTTLSQKGRTVR